MGRHAVVGSPLRTDLISKTILWNIEGGRRYFFTIAFFSLKLSPFALRRFQSTIIVPSLKNTAGPSLKIILLHGRILRGFPFGNRFMVKMTRNARPL